MHRKILHTFLIKNLLKITCNENNEAKILLVKPQLYEQAFLIFWIEETCFKDF